MNEYGQVIAARVLAAVEAVPVTKAAGGVVAPWREAVLALCDHLGVAQQLLEANSAVLRRLVPSQEAGLMPYDPQDWHVGLRRGPQPVPQNGYIQPTEEPS